jgi:hypothetical protein
MALSKQASEKIKKEGIKFPGVMGADDLDADMEADGLYSLFFY